MGNKFTIIDAIKRVLENSKGSLTHKQIYKEIVSSELYEFSAKSPEQVVSSLLRKHCYGLDFPSASPKKIFSIDRKANGPTHYQLWNGELLNEYSKEKENSKQDLLPEEVIHRNYKSHLESLKKELLEYIHASDPAFFERLVLDLLLKMGYGGNDDLAGMVVGGSGDHGIDGIINEDKLGLESIYIQAKRYTSNSVTPNEVREFIGSMSLKGARKGVFFSSSRFSKQAREHANDSTAVRITLVDGEELCDLLVQNGMGVVKVRQYEIFSIDKNFFEV